MHNSGMPALAAIEAIPTDAKDKPKDEVVLVKATVFSNPITEMEDALEQELQVKIDEREVSDAGGVAGPVLLVGAKAASLAVTYLDTAGQFLFACYTYPRRVRSAVAVV